jgi:hypothetical protein
MAEDIESARKGTVAERLTRIETILEERLPTQTVSSKDFDDLAARVGKLETARAALWAVVGFLGFGITIAATLIGVFVH